MVNAANIPAPPEGDLGNIPPPPGYGSAYVPALVAGGIIQQVQAAEEAKILPGAPPAPPGRGAPRPPAGRG